MERGNPEDVPSERPLSVMGAAGWALLASLGFQLALGLSEEARPGAATDLVTIGTCNVLGHLLVVVGMLRLHAPSAPLGAFLGLTRPRWSTLPLAALAGAGISPLASWLSHVMEKRYPLSPEETELLEKVFSVETVGKRVAMAVVLVLLMPLCDELFYRGALFSALKRRHTTLAVIVTTATFDTLVGSGSTRALLSSFVLALVLGVLRAKGESIVVSLVAAMAFFGVDVVPIVLGRAEPSYGPTIIAGGVAVALASVALAWWLGAPIEDARESES